MRLDRFQGSPLEVAGTAGSYIRIHISGNTVTDALGLRTYALFGRTLSVSIFCLSIALNPCRDEAPVRVAQ